MGAVRTGGGDNMRRAKHVLLQICGQLSKVHHHSSPSTRNITNTAKDVNELVSNSIGFSRVLPDVFHRNHHYYHDGFTNPGPIQSKEHTTGIHEHFTFPKNYIITSPSSVSVFNSDFKNGTFKSHLSLVKEIVQNVYHDSYKKDPTSHELDVHTKHTLLVFPELLLLTEVTGYNLDLIKVCIDFIIFNKEYETPKNIVQFRQFKRSTCWIASSLNAIYLLETKLKKNITCKFWNECKQTLDVNNFAKQILKNKPKMMQDNALDGAGFYPSTVWKYANNFGISEKHIAMVSLPRIVLHACTTLFQTNIGMDEAKKNNVIRLLATIREMRKQEVGIICIYFGLISSHIITIYKNEDDGFEIHDSDKLNVYTSAELYMDSYDKIKIKQFVFQKVLSINYT
jgi:hypothetical protein